MTDTRKALEDAWESLAQSDKAFRRFACAIIDDRGTTNGGKFANFLDAEAYLDAAVMLVPEGWNACIWTTGAVTLRHPVNPMKDIPANGETPALALLAAILKTKGQNDE